MSNFLKYGWILSLFFLSLTRISATSPIEINNDSSLLLNNRLYIYTDSNSLDIEDVVKLPDSMFQRAHLQVPNLGISDNTFWIKFYLKNNTENRDLVLRFSNPILDLGVLYHQIDDSSYISQALGENFFFKERKYLYPDYIFDLNLEPNKEKVYFLKVKSSKQILVPLSVGSITNVIYSSKSKDVIFGIYTGIIVVMFLYNFFIFFVTKDKSYLYYIAYIFTVGLVQLTFAGYSYEYIWPDNLWLSKHGLLIFGSLSGITIMLFVYEFLQIKIYSKIIKLVIWFVTGLYVIALIAALFDQYGFSYRLIDLSGLLLSISLLSISIYIAKKGYRPAFFFLIAWIIFLVGLFVFIFRSLGILPYNNFTNYTMPAGSALEVILLSLALADRINILKKEKADAQKRELEVLNENHILIENKNIELEQMVGERTEDLLKTNKELNETLTKLQIAQVQLVESEKMVSLGQLTAGVAHEINNPINFVLSNVSPLRRDLEDLLAIIEAYEAVKENSEQGFSKVDELKKNLNFDYLKEEITQILAGIENGAERTSEIVKSLRMFSRLDESEQKKAAIGDCIESTLTVLTSKIKDFSVIVKKDFQFTDEINCYPGKLNQVFMNLINNSLDALENKQNAELSFTIEEQDNWIKVAISDNGIGIPENIQDHIFDPFFTTKDVGKGTGLGMSIVYSIIQDHNGKILLDSKEGIGTTFHLFLPKKK